MLNLAKRFQLCRGFARHMRSSSRLASIKPSRIFINPFQPTFDVGSGPCILPVRGLKNRTLCFKKMPIDYPLLTGSDHWRRKIRTVFQRLDANDDGYITEEDLVTGALRAAQYLGLSDEQAEPYIKLRHEVWKGLAQGVRNGKVTKISQEEHRENSMAYLNQRKFRLETYPQVILAGFDNMDIDGDGRISQREFAAFFYSLNAPVEYSKDVFDVLDENKDGFISLEEYAQAHVEFWFSEDPNSKYNEFLGPLVP